MKFIFLNNTNRLPVRTLKIIESLKKRGHWVFIINWQRNENEYSNYENLVDGFRIVKTRNINLFLMKSFRFLLKINHDCISCNDVRFLPLAILISKLKKVKILYDYKEYPPATFAQKFSKYFKKEKFLLNFFEKLEAILLFQTHGILSIPLLFSQNNGIIQHKNKAIIYNVPSKRDLDESWIEYYRVKYKNYILLIYAGTMFEDKGLTKYLNLISMLKKNFPNIKLILVGDFKQRITIPSYCREYVELISYLPYHQLLGLLSICKIGLALFNPNNLKFKYLNSGTSRKIFTYMLCGLPIVASKMPLNKVVEEEQCGFLVNYNNLKEIYNACFKLLTDEKLWSKFSANAKNAILTKYNWEKEEEKILNVLNVLEKL